MVVSPPVLEVEDRDRWTPLRLREDPQRTFRTYRENRTTRRNADGGGEGGGEDGTLQDM